MTRPSRILLVDDELSIQRALVPLLRSRGYEVEAAATGARTRSRPSPAQPPDLVILDLGLPDMDGLEVCRRVRERSDVPIIVLSARGAEPQKVAALDRGADDYVTKPFGPEELLARDPRGAAPDARRAEPSQRPDGARRADDRLRSAPRATGRARRSASRRRSSSCWRCMASRPGQVLTHRAILKAIWGPNAVDQPEHLRVLMAS